jgi:hypothetical protein
MFLYAISSVVADVPDQVERAVQQIKEYLTDALAFVGHAAVTHPNEFVTAFAAFVTMIFTGVLAFKTAGLFKETARLREETAVLAKFAKQQAEDMRSSVAAAQESAKAATVNANVLMATQRAHMEVVKHSSQIIGTSPQDFIGFINQARWQNFGLSTALRVSLNMQVVEIDPAEVSGLTFVLKERNQSDVFSLAPTNQVSTDFVKVLADQAIRAWQGQSRVFSFTRASYWDNLGDEERITEHCAEIVFAFDPRLILANPSDAQLLDLAVKFRRHGPYRVVNENNPAGNNA